MPPKTLQYGLQWVNQHHCPLAALYASSWPCVPYQRPNLTQDRDTAAGTLGMMVEYTISQEHDLLLFSVMKDGLECGACHR